MTTSILNPQALVLGRFQPLHRGHLHLLKTAFSECDEVVVCIGSAQLADPFTVSERHHQLNLLLEQINPSHNWRIVDLEDPTPMLIWPQYVDQYCQMQPTNKVFYRSDPLGPEDGASLHSLGYTLRYLERISFSYLFPDGIWRNVSSATEIKEIYKDLGVPLRKYNPPIGTSNDH